VEGGFFFLAKIEPPPATILEYLIARFPQIGPLVWHERMMRGLVQAEGKILNPESPYRHGITVLYQREVEAEPAPLETESILYEDSEILAADKPHGMPVTPAGEYLARSLLRRLEARVNSRMIAPLHRLDRETAGVVLFSLNPETRARYHALFQKRVIERTYLAVARCSNAPAEKRWIVENRLASGEPWFRQRIVEGAINAITEIELIGAWPGHALFKLRPRTGRKHQLRIHMASIGFPILGDPFYPEIREADPGDPPLQLLAAQLSFIDPISGQARTVTSRRILQRAETGQAPV
jgi:tRNA pseudouridine32 synthase/23S rRNA pseudouridine746 synthase